MWLRTSTIYSAAREYSVGFDRPMCDVCRCCREPRSPPKSQRLAPVALAGTGYRVNLDSRRRTRTNYIRISRKPSFDAHP